MSPENPFPPLTFFCELDEKPLRELFQKPGLIDELKALEARIGLGLRDLSAGRAEVVQLLNRHEIPVTAWLLLPQEKGYWFNIDNVSDAAAFYGSFRNWTDAHQLKWDHIGLDIEPDIRFMESLSANPLKSIAAVVRQYRPKAPFRQAVSQYQDLVAAIHSDGYRVETYQFPLIRDERLARSQILGRSLGLVDLAVNREVYMLYSSFYPDWGEGILWSYARHAQAVAVGITGGGIVMENLASPDALTWEQLVRDLSIASHFTRHVYVFSLEGCVQHGYLKRLAELREEIPLPVRPASFGKINLLRFMGRTALRMVSRSLLYLGLLAAVVAALILIF